MLQHRQSRKAWEIPLRRCQREAIAAWLQQTPDNALLEITPGGGKSIIIARLAHALLESGTVGRVIPVVPTDYLRRQLTELLQSIGVNVTSEYRASMGFLPRHFDGVVTTYQQVAADPPAFSRMAVGAFVPLDEVHHAAAQATWGQALEQAFSPARYRLSLSGTPFREDEARVSFIPYHLGEAQPLYRYGYLDALRDGVVRPVQFEVFGAKVKWRSTDGTEREAETSAPTVSQDDLSERLRALLWSDEWIERVLYEAHQRLLEIRAVEHRNAAGLVVAIDMSHARHIARILGRVSGQMPVLALSDDPQSANKIAVFRSSADPWIVAVRQISEGVDIPRVRVPVHMSNVTTRLFFAQFVARGLRYQSDVGGEQLATAYLPEDPRLLAHAHTFTQAVRAWAKDRKVGTPALIPSAGEAGGGAQHRFEVLESAPYNAGTVRPVPSSGLTPAAESVTAPPPPFPQSSITKPSATSVAVPDIAALRERREEVVRLVTAVAKATGSDHKRIHGLLKRRCGGSLPLATPAQIDARLRLLAAWLRVGRIS